jgi:hypothetical protein
MNISGAGKYFILLFLLFILDCELLLASNMDSLILTTFTYFYKIVFSIYYYWCAVFSNCCWIMSFLRFFRLITYSELRFICVRYLSCFFYLTLRIFVWGRISSRELLPASEVTTFLTDKRVGVLVKWRCSSFFWNFCNNSFASYLGGNSCVTIVGIFGGRWIC